MYDLTKGWENEVKGSDREMNDAHRENPNIKARIIIFGKAAQTFDKNML
jgi:hypothetical protein